MTVVKGWDPTSTVVVAVWIWKDSGGVRKKEKMQREKGRGGQKEEWVQSKNVAVRGRVPRMPRVQGGLCGEWKGALGAEDAHAEWKRVCGPQLYLLPGYFWAC